MNVIKSVSYKGREMYAAMEVMTCRDDDGDYGVQVACVSGDDVEIVWELWFDTLEETEVWYQRKILQVQMLIEE